MKTVMYGALLLGATLALGCGTNGGGPDGGGEGGADVVVVPDAGPAKAVITEMAVDFGAAGCGAAAPANKTVTLKNDGGSPLTWSAKLDASDVFQIVGASGGTLAPGASAQITVSPKPVPSSASPGQQYNTTLNITTSDPALSSTNVPISMTAQGATLTLTPSVADFGVYTVGKQAPDIALTLTNTGNQDAQIAFDTPTNAQFTIDWTGSPMAATVAKGGTMAGLKVHFKAVDINPTTAFAAIKVTGGGVCGGSPTKVDLKGQGTNGALIYSPGTIDFGLTDCGGTAITQSFTVANTGNAALTWSGALSANAPYTLSPLGGVLVPNGSATVQVIPKAIPFPSDITTNLYGATITLTTDAVNDTPHTVTLKQTAQGVILTTTPASLDFGQNGKIGDTKTLTVNNVGNAPSDVTVGLNFPQAIIKTPAQQPATIVGNANQAFVLEANADVLGPIPQGAVAYIAGATGTLCKPLPTNPSVAGTISDGAVTGLGTARYQTSCASVGNRSYCWGYGGAQLGNWNSVVNTRRWGLSDATSVAFSDSYGAACAVTSSGAVKCGGNQWGAQGMAIQNLGSGVTQLATSNNNWFCALKGDAVYCWQVGSNSASQTVASGATSFAMGNWVGGLAVVKSDGTIWTGNPGGSLSQYMGFANATAVSVGGNQICALDTNGAVTCAGYNYQGELNGTSCNPTCYTPSPIPAMDMNNQPLTGALAVSAGGNFTCAIQSNKTVLCWGYNWEGELGNGQSSNGGRAVVNGLSNVSAISAFWIHSCALAAGVVSCWGYNNYGQSQVTQGGNALSPFTIPYL